MSILLLLCQIFQFSTKLANIQKLKLSWESIKQDAMKEQKIYSEECNLLGKPSLQLHVTFMLPLPSILFCFFERGKV